MNQQKMKYYYGVFEEVNYKKDESTYRKQLEFSKNIKINFINNIKIEFID